MRAALYLRVSTDKQDCENQARQLRAFAKKQGWTVAHEYADLGESGGKSNRSAFQQMFADASRRKFDLLLFWALDRLSREGVLPTLRYLERLTSYGVEWRSFTEQFFDSCGPFKDAVISIMAVLAKQERIQRSERTKAGLERARAAGAILGRPRCDVDVGEIRRLRSAGKSWRAIGTILGISSATALYRARSIKVQRIRVSRSAQNRAIRGTRRHARGR
jgi:DNA invertase Pin-like site-specific DNA recombinase